MEGALESLVADFELLPQFIGILRDSKAFENLDDLDGCEIRTKSYFANKEAVR